VLAADIKAGMSGSWEAQSSKLKGETCIDNLEENLRKRL